MNLSFPSLCVCLRSPWRERTKVGFASAGLRLAGESVEMRGWGGDPDWQAR